MSTEPPYRVIVYGTGFVGTMVVREILDHPDYELAAVVVHDPDKDGRDVGELVGLDPVGLTATTDTDAAFAAGADALAHYGPTAEFARVNIETMAAALRSGIDVVSTAMTNFVYWPTADDGMTRPIIEACEEGGTSCFTTGIDPGFANDLLPLTLIGVCGYVESVRIQEILDYSTYTGDYAPMGLGRPMDEQAILEIPEILIMAWGDTIPLMAEALDVELDDIRARYTKWSTPERIEYPNGVIEAGHAAAAHFEIEGIVGGEPRIVIEHVNRVTNAAAPDWPRPDIVENDAYRVIIKGRPDITQETSFRQQGDAAAGGCLATGLRALHAIPAVIAAEPGMLTANDLPVIPGRHNLRQELC